MTGPPSGIALALSEASAAAAAPSATPASFSVPGPDIAAVSHLGPFFIVLLLIAAGGIYVMKNGLPRFGTRRAGERKLRIEEMRSLGNRQFLVVVEYEETKMLLGVAPGKIDYLCPIESRPADFPGLVPTPPADDQHARPR